MTNSLYLFLGYWTTSIARAQIWDATAAATAAAATA